MTPPPPPPPPSSARNPPGGVARGASAAGFVCQLEIKFSVHLCFFSAANRVTCKQHVAGGGHLEPGAAAAPSVMDRGRGVTTGDELSLCEEGATKKVSAVQPGAFWFSSCEKIRTKHWRPFQRQRLAWGCLADRPDWCHLLAEGG